MLPRTPFGDSDDFFDICILTKLPDNIYAKIMVIWVGITFIGILIQLVVRINNRKWVGINNEMSENGSV
jgi:hypothetical protein